MIKIRLAVIQPTSFCNIECSYCYVPNRRDKSVISGDILKNIFLKIRDLSFFSGDVEFLWHCGEPLTVGIGFYEQAIALQRDVFASTDTITNTVQTNGLLLNKEWCRFFRDHNIAIGISLDGPMHIHDANRRRRNGVGTFQDVMRGLRLLQADNIRFGCLAVITSNSLKYPQDMCDFFADNNIPWVGFNIEEVDGFNIQSSMHTEVDMYKQFIEKFIHAWDAGGRKFVFREVYNMVSIINDVKSRVDMAPIEPDKTVPLRIVSFNKDGWFSTFSPELLSARGSGEYKKFFLGNVANDEISSSVVNNSSFVDDILSGIRRCQSECDYFGVCGGGYISNRWAENGAFNSLETKACKLHRKIMADVVIDWIQSRGK